MEEVEAWVVYVDDMAAVRAIETAWYTADPCFARVFDSFAEMTPAKPEIRRVRIDYASSDGILAYEIAHVVRGGTVVLLVRGGVAACQERPADEIAGIEETLTVPGEV